LNKSKTFAAFNLDIQAAFILFCYCRFNRSCDKWKPSGHLEINCDVWDKSTGAGRQLETAACSENRILSWTSHGMHTLAKLWISTY